MNLPEAALVHILSRNPLKSIARFRSVSKEWRSLLDSDFFRNHYISSSSSSSSWSIIQTNPHKLSLEIVGHHGCDTWGLTRSPASYMSFFSETTITKLLVLSCVDGLVSIYAETNLGSPLYYIGNPLFREWFKIPLPPFLSSLDFEGLKKDKDRFSDNGLVTKVEKGILSYKVVWILRPDLSLSKLSFVVYSSETGMWVKKDVSFAALLCPNVSSSSIALNGILHWLSDEPRDASSVVAYDLYGDGGGGDRLCMIRFPSKDDESRSFKRTFSTSGGSVVYFNEFFKGGNRTFRVWKLVSYKDGGSWEVLWSWEIDFFSFDELGCGYFPVVMHPLNSEIIYLWSKQQRGMVLFNLRTHVLRIHKETADENKCMDGCVLSFNGCKEYMDNIYTYGFPRNLHYPNLLNFSQYVLPRWLHRLPRAKPT
ncbi:unnamed protein product [Cochlearia groenlandica]